MMQAQGKRWTISVIKAAAAEAAGIEHRRIWSKDRSRNLVRWRFAAYVAMSDEGYPTHAIAFAMGCDHTTIRNGIIKQRVAMRDGDQRAIDADAAIRRELMNEKWPRWPLNITTQALANEAKVRDQPKIEIAQKRSEIRRMRALYQWSVKSIARHFGFSETAVAAELGIEYIVTEPRV